MGYLSVAHNIAMNKGIYKRWGTDFYGNDLLSMQKIGKKKPYHEHLLEVHAPGYSIALGFVLKIIDSDFWAVYALHTSLFILIIGFVYYFTYYFTRQILASIIAASVAVFSPVLTLYMGITMMEIICVFGTIFTLFLTTRPICYKNSIYLTISLSLLIICRETFLILTGAIFLTGLIGEYRKNKYIPWHILIILILPVTIYWFFGRNGTTWYLNHVYHSGRSIESLLGAEFLMENINRILSFRVDSSLLYNPMPEKLHELFVYGGITILLLSLTCLYKHRLFYILLLTHFGIIAAVFLGFDWAYWRQVRLTMWFAPFTYILFFSWFCLTKFKSARFIVLILTLPFICTGLLMNYRIMTERWPKEWEEMKIHHEESIFLKGLMDKHYPGAKFIVTVLHDYAFFIAVPLYDKERIHYFPGRDGLLPTLISFRELNELPDAIVLASTRFLEFPDQLPEPKEREFWSQNYRRDKNISKNLDVIVRREKPKSDRGF